MAKRPSGLKGGETVPQSGLYQQVGPRGGSGPEVNSAKGEPLPPAPVKETMYKLVNASFPRAFNRPRVCRAAPIQ